MSGPVEDLAIPVHPKGVLDRWLGQLQLLGGVVLEM